MIPSAMRCCRQASIAHRVTAFFEGQLSPDHYSEQHIKIYESLSSGEPEQRHAVTYAK